MTDKTDAVIIGLLVRLRRVYSRIRLAKLVYMADCNARGWLGRPLTDLVYKLDQKGPYDVSLPEHVEHCKPFVQEARTQFASGPGYTYDLIQAPPAGLLSAVEDLILEYTISAYAKLPNPELIEDHVYETAPMTLAKERGLPLGSPLPMESLDNGIKRSMRVDLEQAVASLKAFDEGDFKSGEEILKLAGR